MKSIFSLIRNLKSFIPYLLLVFTYFFFINLEANNDNDKYIKKNKPSFEDGIAENSGEINSLYIKKEKINTRITIPVIPYKHQ